MDRGGSAAPAYAICPRVIKLEWPAQDTKMTIDLGRMKINGQVAVETFQMPRVGGKQIDLGRDRPTGRSVINPAGYR